MLQQIEAGVGSAIEMVMTFIPRFLAFLAVLIIGYFVAKAIEKAMDAILERVGFDRLVERGGVKKALARSKFDASSLLSRVVFYIVMLFVLQLSFGVWGPNPVTDMLNSVVAYLPNVLAALVIVVVGAAIAAAVREIVSAAMGGLAFGKALATAASVAILVVTGFAALDQLNIAPAIVTGLFYAILATFVGILIVSVGGSGIQPMREYWGRFLTRMDREMPQVQAAARQAPDRTRERIHEREEQAKKEFAGTRSGGGGGSEREGSQRGGTASPNF
jgi:hypothetical protein